VFTRAHRLPFREQNKANFQFSLSPLLILRSVLILFSHQRSCILSGLCPACLRPAANVIITRPLMIFPGFCESQCFINLFTRTFHFSMFCQINRVHAFPPYCFKILLILSFYLRFGLPSGLPALSMHFSSLPCLPPVAPGSSP